MWLRTHLDIIEALQDDDIPYGMHLPCIPGD